MPGWWKGRSGTTGYCFWNPFAPSLRLVRDWMSRLQCFLDFYTCLDLYKNTSKPNRYAASEGILMIKFYRNTVSILQVVRWTLL